MATANNTLSDLKALAAPRKAFVRQLEEVVEANTPYSGDGNELVLNEDDRRELVAAVMRLIEDGPEEPTEQLANSELAAKHEGSAKINAKLGEAWNTLHGIERVAQMLWDADGDDVTHGVAFTIRQAAQRGYEAIDCVSEELRKAEVPHG